MWENTHCELKVKTEKKNADISTSVEWKQTVNIPADHKFKEPVCSY